MKTYKSITDQKTMTNVANKIEQRIRKDINFSNWEDVNIEREDDERCVEIFIREDGWSLDACVLESVQAAVKPYEASYTSFYVFYEIVSKPLNFPVFGDIVYRPVIRVVVQMRGA